MRRKHHRETKVWHNPLLAPVVDGRNASPIPIAGSENADADHEAAGGAAKGRRRAARIVAKKPKPRDPDTIEQDRLVTRLLVAEGPTKITSAYSDIIRAGFTPPKTQAFWLQVLEHNDEEIVVLAIEQLAQLVTEDEAQRRKVLDSRLRRIEEFADEPNTQQAAGELRRTLSQLSSAPRSRNA